MRWVMLLALFFIPIDKSNSHIAKTTDALYTIKLAVELGYSKLWLEGDYLNIINTLNKKILFHGQ